MAGINTLNYITKSNLLRFLIFLKKLGGFFVSWRGFAVVLFLPNSWIPSSHGFEFLLDYPLNLLQKCTMVVITQIFYHNFQVIFGVRTILGTIILDWRWMTIDFSVFRDPCRTLKQAKLIIFCWHIYLWKNRIANQFVTLF